MIVYIVQMEKSKTADPNVVDYKDVDEPHRYVAGVFSDYKQAHKAGKAEVKWRHGRYNYCVHDHVLDHINKTKIKYKICLKIFSLHEKVTIEGVIKNICNIL